MHIQTQQQKSKVKINNSYESDPSSGSGSSLSEQNDGADDDDMNLATMKGITCTDRHTGKNISTYVDRPLRYGRPAHSSQESSFEGFGESPHGELQKLFYDVGKSSITVTMEKRTVRTPTPPKMPPPPISTIEENSCNAVDLQLPTTIPNGYSKLSSSSTQPLSFNGRIENLTQESLATATAPFAITIICERPAASSQLENQTKSILTDSQHRNTLYKSERSPDLFGDDDDTDAEEHDAVRGEEKKPNINDQLNCNNEIQNLSTTDEHHANVESFMNADANLLDTTSDGTAGMLDTKQCYFRENCRRERELLRRIRKSLAGVPPPPSLTIPQLNIFETVHSNKTNILDYLTPILPKPMNDTLFDTTSSLFKPTHTMEEAKNASWNTMKEVRHHGLCLNLTKASENIEYLSLAVIERFIGSETASSYHNITTPSSAKKRNIRLKLLTKSPGNRLSHLAKRRAIFSSVNLATTSQKSLGPQILIDKKKSSSSRHRRKATPKRKTPGSKRKTRKTPSSSGRKPLAFLRCDVRPSFPSRETSKRALFQSPAKLATDATATAASQMDQKLCIKPEIANRVEKSKRALFSPEKLSNDNNLSLLKTLPTSLSLSSKLEISTSSKLENLLKRKRRNSIDDNTDSKDDSIELSAHGNKLFRGSFDNLTPRALKIKSQSFCIGAGSTSANVAANTSKLVNNTTPFDASYWNDGSNRNSSSSTTNSSMKMQRARSDMIVPTNSLTENQRKKLLWAVSQALQERKITAKHESFKQYASILARVVRRIFQEYYQKSSTSNSETMLRLAKKFAYNVIAGKGADDVYMQAKTHIDEVKRQCSSRLCGYIGPAEYEQLKVSQQSSCVSSVSQLNSVSSIFTQESSLDGFINTSSIAVSQTSSCTQGSCAATATKTSPQQYSTQNTDRLPIQENSTLENSSSKNNLGMLALRENVDSEQRRSAQKNFTGKDQRNLSPYYSNSNSGVKVQSLHFHQHVTETNTVKRQIKFDS